MFYVDYSLDYAIIKQYSLTGKDKAKKKKLTWARALEK